MLTPIKVSSKENCIQRVNSILHSGLQDNTNTDTQITELLKNSFKDNTDYRVVYKNFDYNTPYDTWIYEGNDKDKIVGFKYLQSYPYETPQFHIGDYIHWNFNHKELSTWILISLDTQYLYNVKGRMLQCNNSLRWTDKKGELNCYPCVIEDALTYTNFKWGSKGVVENGSDIVVVVQRNQYTSQIQVNDRFIFNGKGFKVKADFNNLNPDYMELYMSKSPELDQDNLEDNIAINKEPKNEIKLDGIIIEPDINKILLGESVDFNVYNYINGIKQEDKFLVKATGVPFTYFKITTREEGKEMTDSINTFSIENLKQYQISPLVVECENKNTGEKINKKIWLGGNW